MLALRLPVAGVDVRVTLPTGNEDVLLVEAGTPNIGVALALLDRVVDRHDGAPIEWRDLSVTDVDVLLLRLRQRVLGDVITADVYCAAEGCGARVDIVFSIAGFIAHHTPHTPPQVLAASESGWFRLADSEVEFRLPCAGDQLAIALEPQPELALIQRCIRPVEISESAREHVESAMDALAPSLFSELQGTCPECSATVRADFDPLQYTLRELRDQAGYVYEEVAAIAHHMHWSEREILSMPTARRLRYAELAAEVH